MLLTKTYTLSEILKRSLISNMTIFDFQIKYKESATVNILHLKKKKTAKISIIIYELNLAINLKGLVVSTDHRKIHEKLNKTVLYLNKLF